MNIEALADTNKPESGKTILPAFQVFVVVSEIALACITVGSIFPYYQKQLRLYALEHFPDEMTGAQPARIVEFFTYFGNLVSASPVLTALAIITFGVALWFVLKKLIKPKKPLVAAIILLGGTFLVTVLFFAAMTRAIFIPLSQFLPCAHCITPEEVIQQRIHQPPTQGEQQTQ